MNPKYKKHVVETCRRYYHTMRTYGKPPENFTLRDYKIVDDICELIRDKYKNRLVENLSEQEQKYLDIFTPELLSHAKY